MSKTPKHIMSILFVANGWRFRLDSIQFIEYMLQNIIIVIFLWCNKWIHMIGDASWFLLCQKGQNKLLLLLLFYVWQSPGLPGWRKVNLITVTHRPHHPSIAAGLYCLTTSPGLLPALCEKWSGFFYVHRVLLSYTRDRRLKVSSERLGNEDKAPCPRTLLPGWGSNRGPPGWTSEVLTARPRQLLKRISEVRSIKKFVQR